jgi:excisionase family DNA binding protein
MTHVLSVAALVNEIEAARQLGISVKTIRRWRWAGRGPVFRKIGGSVRYHPADLEAFIEAGRRQSTAEAGRAA